MRVIEMPVRRISGMFGTVVDRVASGYRFVRLYSQHLPLAFEAIFAVRCVARRLEGTLKEGTGRATVLYAGRGKNYTYLCRMLFDESRVIEEQATNLLAVRKHVARMSQSVDLVVVDLGWPYNGPFNRARDHAEIPDWVNMSIELPGTWEEVVQGFRHTTRNNDLRLIRRNRYHCESTNDPAALEEFYDRYYVPFVRHKHEGDSLISPRKHVLKRGRQGALLQVMRGDEVVSAGIVYGEGDTMFFLWMGLPPQYLERPPEAAISALYFFGIRHAFDRGFRAVDFTGNRAFLNDGAFRFKRKWGARVEDTFSPGSILVRPIEGSRNAARLCQNLPVLLRSGDELEALFLFADDPVTDATLARLHKDYGCEGIDRMTVMEVSNENETKAMPIRTDACEYQWLACSLESFAKAYVTH